MDMMKELMKKKSAAGSMDPKEKSAKLGVLKQISAMASKAMGDDVRGSLNKVEVAAPDASGLKEGLAKASELVSKHGAPMDTDAMDDSADGDSPEVDTDESSEPEESSLKEHAGNHPGKAENMLEQQIDEESDEGDLSEEDLDALIADLQAKKAALRK